MEVMGDSTRSTDPTLWGAPLSMSAHKAPPSNSLRRSESTPHGIFDAFSQSSGSTAFGARRPVRSHARSQSMSQNLDFLDSPADERSVSFGINTMLLEDEEEEAPDIPVNALFSKSSTSPGLRGLADKQSGASIGAPLRRSQPQFSSLSTRPPTQPSLSRRQPSRSVSSHELVGILNGSGSSRAPGSQAPPSASTLERLPKNASADKKAAASHWPKSVFDMIQDDFPRTPSPMLSSLVPSKTVATARELRTVQLHPRIPSAERRTRAASSAALDLDYGLFGKAATQDEPSPPNDFDPIFGPSDESRWGDETFRPRRGHRRSVSINLTGDIPGLLEEQQPMTKRSALKASQSSYLFPTVSLSSSPPKTVQSRQSGNGTSAPGGIGLDEGRVTPPHSRSQPTFGDPVGVPRSSSPLDATSKRSPMPQTAPHSDVDGLGQINSNGSLHSNLTAVADANVHMPYSAAAADAVAYPEAADYNFLYERPDAHYATVTPGMPMGGDVLGNPNMPLPNPATAPWGFSQPTHPSFGAGASLPQTYAHTFRDAADNMKNLSMQMAMFFNAQQQLYAAQMAQMAALTGGAPFNSATIFNAPNASMFNNQYGGMQHQPSRSSWEMRDSPHGQRRSRPYTGAGGNGMTAGKKEGSSGKSRGGRGRRSRTNDDASAGRLGMTGGMSGNVMDNHARSALLEDFRATSLSISRGIISSSDLGHGFASGGSPTGAPQREWALIEIKGHVNEFATDQHGSRFIQHKLEAASDEDKASLLSEAMSEAQRLMTDVFGNYVIQKLLDHGGEAAVAAISSELEGRMLSLSLHMYGCRVVQKALEVIESETRAKLVRELDGHVTKCIRDQNGNHVIQKCVELVESDAVQFIVDAVLGQAVALAGHSYGCRVVQRILEHGASHQKAPIMAEIMAAIPELIKDQYGNYVIQHVVEHGSHDERAAIMTLVRGQVRAFSQHKFASNVVERCLQFGTADEREVLIEMLTVGDDGGTVSSPLNHLVRDQFGNYVVQRVLDVAKPAQRERVAAILRPQVPAIRKYSYGKHILARLDEGGYETVGYAQN